MHKDNVLAAKPQDDMTFFDLARQNFIFIDQSKIMPLFTRMCEEYGISGNIKLVNSDWETVRGFIKFNLGVHLYSDICDKSPKFIDQDLVSKNIKHLFPCITTKSITKSGVIFNKNKDLFLRLLKEETANIMSNPAMSR
jgi:hypothetical protein